MDWKKIMSGYQGYSIGGNVMPGSVLQRYEQLAQAHARTLGLPFHYRVYPKKKWNAERQEM
jgi:hypothetical protein